MSLALAGLEFALARPAWTVSKGERHISLGPACALLLTRTAQEPLEELVFELSEEELPEIYYDPLPVLEVDPDYREL